MFSIICNQTSKHLFFPKVRSIDEIVEHIGVMCDDKNNKIKSFENVISKLQQRLENITISKALYSNEEIAKQRAEDELKSMDDVVSSIEALCDDKNTMIKNLEPDKCKLEQRLENINAKIEPSNHATRCLFDISLFL